MNYITSKLKKAQWGFTMVKLLVKDYALRVSDKIRTCDECFNTIDTGDKYYKYSSKDIFHSLHVVCYAKLSLKSAEINIKTVRKINDGI